MIHLIFDQNEPHIYQKNLIQLNDFELFDHTLKILKDNSIQAITINNNRQLFNLYDTEFVSNISRILQDQGTFNICAEEDEIFQLLLAGAQLKRTQNKGQYKKLGTQNHFMDKIKTKIYEVQQNMIQLQNVYGHYDQVSQKFLKNQKSNPFSETFQEQKQLIDEESLINDNLEVKIVESCVTQPKACKNCSCGRKEVEQAKDASQLLQELQQGQVKSSCGSCYLGDAFRCANCPYKGLPSFKPGQKVQIETNQSEQAPQVEVQNTQIQGGKVKLQI